jgi:hypothetical protein
MKLIGIVLSLVLLSACAQLMNGQEQPIKLLKTNIYMTTCSGAAENWGNCNSKASRTCNGSYTTLEKNESAIASKKELIFECNK